MAYTPGPWVYDGRSGRILHKPDKLMTFVIAEMESGRDSDARLIAAAPDLLDSLKEFVAAAYAIGLRHDALRNRVERAERAIAKAEGRAP